MKPQNGEKTHPLKPASIAVLRELATGPLPSYRVNPGTRNRLRREGLADEIERVGARPYRRYAITQAGRDRLAEIDHAAAWGGTKQ